MTSQAAQSKQMVAIRFFSFSITMETREATLEVKMRFCSLCEWKMVRWFKPRYSSEKKIPEPAMKKTSFFFKVMRENYSPRENEIQLLVYGWRPAFPAIAIR